MRCELYYNMLTDRLTRDQSMEFYGNDYNIKWMAKGRVLSE
jgi:hypothetical protein